MGKLDELCAIKVMDWAMNIEMFPGGLEYAVWVNVKDNSPTLYYDHISQSIWRDPQFVPIASKQWRPSVDLNDALVCLERAAPAGTWYCNKNATEVPERQYWAADSAKHEAYASTAALAMCICALRAMGVPESEISLAMGEK